MSDTISRQAAIDAVKKNTFRLTFAEEQNCEGRVAWSADAVYSDVIEGALLELPSAQPEQDREFIKLTVRNSNGRPYYSIIYLELDDNGVGHDFEGYSSYSLDVISDYLKKYFMPSAQPNLQPACNQLATDVISRQEAIDALKEHRALYCDNTPDSFSKLSYAEKSRVDELDTAIATIVNLPSADPKLRAAQSEIVRCKDCKYWEQNAQHGFDEDNEEYHNYCARLVPDDDYYAFTREANDFCSYAERRADE